MGSNSEGLHKGCYGLSGYETSEDESSLSDNEGDAVTKLRDAENSEVKPDNSVDEELLLVVNDCDEIGPNEHDKMMVKCKVCGMVMLKSSFWKHHRDQHQLRRCNYCAFRCLMVEDLKKHMNLHRDLIKCTESFCKAKFRCKQDYLDHIQLVHNCLPDQMECWHCGKLFIDITALKAHYISHGNEFPHACSICEKRYKTKASLKMHMKTHEDTRTYQCEICQQGFYRADKFEKHVRKHEGDLCETEDRLESIGERDPICHHYEQNYEEPVSLVKCIQCGLVCRSCGSIFATRQLSRSHSHKNLCTICGRKSTHQKAHAAHQRYHADVNEYKCEMCQLGFLKLRDIDLHNKKQHGISIPNRSEEERNQTALKVLGKSEFICDICNKTYCSSSSFSVHMLKHSKPKNFQCELCEEHFQTVTLLNFHMARHRGEKHHACSQCQKAFVRKTDLYRHERTHNSVAEVECEYCGMKLKSQRNYRLHVQCHQAKAGGAELKCDCGMTFLRKSHLSSHKETCQEKGPKKTKTKKAGPSLKRKHDDVIADPTQTHEEPAEKSKSRDSKTVQDEVTDPIRADQEEGDLFSVGDEAKKTSTKKTAKKNLDVKMKLVRTKKKKVIED